MLQSPHSRRRPGRRGEGVAPSDRHLNPGPRANLRHALDALGEDATKLKDEATLVRNRLVAVNGEINNLVGVLAKMGADAADLVKEGLARLKREREQLQGKLKELDAAKAPHDVVRDQAAKFVTGWTDIGQLLDEADLAEHRVILQHLVHSLVLTATDKHLETIKALTSPRSTEDAFAARTSALNRVIEGWGRYFQYAHLAGREFHRLTHETYWLFARWLATKHKLSYPQVMRRFKVAGTLGVPGLVLTPHSRFKRQKYYPSPHKLNPYLTGERIEREELLESAPWTGADDRPGRMDLRLAILQRDSHRCQKCGKSVRPDEAQVDHKRPYSCFKRRGDADAAANLWTLCIPCHKEKTESDR